MEFQINFFKVGCVLPIVVYILSCEIRITLPSGGRTPLYEFNFSFKILFLVIQTVFSIEPFFYLENVELTTLDPVDMIIVYVNGHFYDLRIEPKILILLIR